MSKSLISCLLFAFFAVVTSASAQETVSCGNDFFPFKVGTLYEMTYFDENNKMTSRVEYIVQGIEPLEDGTVDAMVTTMMYDENNKQLMDGVFDVYCSNNIIKLDLSTYFSPASMEAFRDMELEMSGNGMEIPPILEEGMTLKDGDMEIKVGTPGGPSMTLSIKITNRKVEALESVTTEAGSFLCYKITQDTDMMMGVRRKTKNVEYYTHGIGLVRTESYDETGKLISHVDMTRFN